MFKNVITLGLFLLASFVVVPAYAACTTPTRAEGAIIYNDDSNALQVCALSTWVALHKGDTGTGGCTGPARGEGAVIYNADSNIPQVCSGSTWVALGWPNAGAGSGGCTAPVGIEGKIIYNNDNDLVQYCDGSAWQQVMGPRSTPACPNVGDVCTDGTIYAGVALSGHIYTTRCDAGQTWDGSACTGLASALSWGNYGVDSPLYNCSGETDCELNGAIDGRTNTNTLVIFSGGYSAAQYCYNLSIHGKADWYLPAVGELGVMYNNKTAIGNFSTAYYWSSSEFSSTSAWRHNFSTGVQTSYSKSFSNLVRCLRRY